IKGMDRQGIRTEKNAVGDRYVLGNVRENGYAIGGEEGGHGIVLRHATTDDGEHSAGELLQLLAGSDQELGEANDIHPQLAQVLAGVIENEQQTLMGMGRVLVRVSGTEPKIRVMVEGEDLDAIHACARRIVERINQRILKK